MEDEPDREEDERDGSTFEADESTVAGGAIFSLGIVGAMLDDSPSWCFDACESFDFPSTDRERDGDPRWRLRSRCRFPCRCDCDRESEDERERDLERE